MANVNNIAKQVVKFSSDKNYPITNLSLQKLMYFLQKEYYLENGTLLFEEKFNAFQYGPVLPKVWQQYREYGNNIIPSDSTVEIEEYINLISRYLKYGAWQLVELSHCEKSWKENVGGFYSEIEYNELMGEWNDYKNNSNKWRC